jgi:hypothetical protein
MPFARLNETHVRVSVPLLAPQIEMRAPEALKPNPRNARKRTKREVKRIAESIKSAGNLQPIVTDEHDVILAGHGRLAAAKLLGLETVPTIRAVGLTEAQKTPVRDRGQQAVRECRLGPQRAGNRVRGP